MAAEKEGGANRAGSPIPGRPGVTRLPDGSERVEGPTPNGGAYAIRYIGDDGSSEIVEFAEDGTTVVGRTYFDAPRTQ